MIIPYYERYLIYIFRFNIIVYMSESLLFIFFQEETQQWEFVVLLDKSGNHKAGNVKRESFHIFFYLFIFFSRKSFWPVTSVADVSGPSAEMHHTWGRQEAAAECHCRVPAVVCETGFAVYLRPVLAKLNSPEYMKEYAAYRIPIQEGPGGVSLKGFLKRLPDKQSNLLTRCRVPGRVSDARKSDYLNGAWSTLQMIGPLRPYICFPKTNLIAPPPLPSSSPVSPVASCPAVERNSNVQPFELFTPHWSHFWAVFILEINAL